MQPTAKSGSRIVETDIGHEVNSVLFVEDGRQVLSGDAGGMLRRWRVEDGQEIGEPIRAEGAEIFAVALSPDRKWLACGLRGLDVSDGCTNVRVWNVQSHEKVLDIHGHTNSVCSVDISPDSTKLATGSFDRTAFIHNLTSGERLVGPLEHDGRVVAVRFSPNGDRIATAAGHEKDTKSIRVYDCDNDQQLLDIPCRFWCSVSSPLAWSANGRQLFAAASGAVKCFDASSGALLYQWDIPGGQWAESVVPARNQKFAVTTASHSLFFWDTSTRQQIGTVIKSASNIWSISLSPDDNYIATGDGNGNGKITIRSLHDILPSSYLTVNLPFIYISEAVFESWKQGDFARVEALLTADTTQPSDSLHKAHALAYRAIVRSRSEHWDTAIDDAKRSIEIQPSVIGYVANTVAHIRNGEHESAIRIFDLVFAHCLPSENKLLLLIKAAMMFECGKHDDAILRVGDLINVVDDQAPYLTVRAQMLFLLGTMSMRDGYNKRAIELLGRAQEAIPFRQSSYLTLISLIFGWDFEGLAPAIQLHLWKAMYAVDHTNVSEPLSTVVETLGKDASIKEVTAAWDPDLVQKCLATFERNGDVAAESGDPRRAIVQYSTALYLNPSNPMSLLVKRSNAQATLGLWEEALKDANDAIKTDPSSPWGHETRYAALHGLRRYDEAMSAFSCMHSLAESSPDPAASQLAKRYISPSQLKTVIDDAVRRVSKTSPLVLIDVKSGRLCSEPERTHMFRLEPQFKELVSSMAKGLDDARIHQVVVSFFRYVTLSHVWEGKEPLFQDVNQVDSIWMLDSSPLNDKLRKFCEMVRTDGHRWAWSDTCCIDKTIGTVLNQSLRMMYKWYEASAATFVFLSDVASPSARGGLKGSKWLTRAWTSQELLAPIVVRFYTRDWKPYLGDTQSNHKESPEIMEELADAIGVARSTISAFNPDDLSTREKLRLASTRKATVDEDIAYSLIGIFQSDIRPEYGEGDAAVGHLLEEIVTRSGEVTVLAWNGKSSSYNSCLPASLEVYSRPPGSSLPITDTAMDEGVAALRKSLSQTDAVLVHDRIIRLPPARFGHRRLYLPCIIFTVRQLGLQGFPSSQENHYRAKVSGIGDVTFKTSDRLPLAEPRKLIFVNPWIRELCDPLEGFRFPWGSVADDDDSGSEPNSEPTSPLQALPTTAMDEYTRALRLIVRLQQQFHALLLEQQSNGEFKRVAAEHEIIVPGIKRLNHFSRDIQTGVVEVL